MNSSSDERHRRGQVAVHLGLTANIFLAALKTVVGVLGHSPALLADGINSTSDVAYYLVVMVFMRLSRKPPDQAHPYGHSQLESVASLVVGAFVVTTAVSIFWDGVNTVYDLLTGAETIPASAQIALSRLGQPQRAFCWANWAMPSWTHWLGLSSP
jgi:cation diffusion facilitator family transporter